MDSVTADKLAKSRSSFVRSVVVLGGPCALQAAEKADCVSNIYTHEELLTSVLAEKSYLSSEAIILAKQFSGGMDRVTKENEELEKLIRGTRCRRCGSISIALFKRLGLTWSVRPCKTCRRRVS